jgi:hypothetical protein
MTLELNELERAALLALVGLAVSVMQNDEENGREFIQALSQSGIEPVCRSLVEKLNGVDASA